MTYLPIVWFGLSVLLAWRRPGFFVGCALASFQFSSFYATPVLGPAFTLSLFGLLAFIAVSRERIPLTRFDGAIIAFSVFYLSSAFYAGDPFGSAEIAARFASIIITYYYAGRAFVQIPGYGKNFIVDVGFSIVALTVVFGYLAAIDISSSARLTLREGNAVGFSQMVDVALGFCVFYLLSSLHKLRQPVTLLLVAALCGTAWVAVLNATRGTLISIGVAVAAYLLLRILIPLGRILVTGRLSIPPLMSRFRFFGALSIIAGAGTVFVDYILSLPQYVASANFLLLRFAVLLDGGGESSAERMVRFQAAWDHFLQAPLLGRGVGSYAHISIYKYPHNMVLELLAECGIVGAAFFIAIVVAALMKSIQSLRLMGYSPNCAVAFGILSTVVIHQKVSFALWMAKPLFLFMGVVVSMNAIARREKREQAMFARRQAVPALG